ncbi:MAG: hypothetical protein MUE40_12590 [Anaerolineae bacterium]|nr:hypothetical protein [Anaerolineae bacterium]
MTVTVTATPALLPPVSSTPVDARQAEMARAIQDSLYYFRVALAPATTAVPTLTPVSMAAPAAATATPTAIPDAAADVRLVYDDASFALINTAGRPLDLKPMAFESSSGSLAVTRWQTDFLTEPLNAFTPADCLQVWGLNQGTEAVLPRPAGCVTRHAWIVVNAAGQFWRSAESFRVFYGGRVIATCATAAGVCNVSLAGATYTPPSTAATPFTVAGVDLQLIVAERGATLLNTSGQPVDVSRLVFSSSSGTFAAWRWQIPELSRPLTALPPGDCLQVWSLDTNYLNPPADCRVRHAWVTVSQSESFWLNTATFTVRQDDTPLATCPAAGTCAIDLP